MTLGLGRPSGAAGGQAATPAVSPAAMSRRALLATPLAGATVGVASATSSDAGLLRELDAKIRQSMETLAIPGAAVGLVWRGREHVGCFGINEVGQARPVDADTAFRIASTTKTFTGLAAMRLVEAGRLSLDERVDHYLSDFQPPPGGGAVTVRQCFNHSAGWLGYDYHDTGSDDGALARYTNDIRRLPQLTPAGQVFSYNNAAVSVGGRVVEAVTGTTYEDAVRQLVLEPLGLARSGFSRRELGNVNLATPHSVENGKAVADPALFRLPRSCHPFGGLLSSITDQLAYARFMLGDGHTVSGARLMRAETLWAMRSNLGPGGTLLVEMDGMGVTWMTRPTAEGVTVVQHGGDLPGFHSGFVMVPNRDFAMTVLTNSESGRHLIAALFADDWALRCFAGVSNVPASPQRLSAGELAGYEGEYRNQQIGFDGPLSDASSRIAPAVGQLQMVTGEGAGRTATELAFYRADHVLVGKSGLRADFLRDARGRVEWLRLGGRLLRRAS